MGLRCLLIIGRSLFFSDIKKTGVWCGEAPCTPPHGQRCRSMPKSAKKNLSRWKAVRKEAGPGRGSLRSNRRAWHGKDGKGSPDGV